MNNKVLIVDDSPADILLLKRLMKGSPFEFDSVESIQEAELYFEKNLPVAIILDYLLPGGDSMSIIDKYHNNMAIILLTGMEDPEIGLSAVKRGAQDFLIKGSINKNLLQKSLQYSLERQTLKKRVNSVEKMATLGRMSSGIAHEMNTPIQYVSDNLYFLEKEFSSILKNMQQIQSLVEAADDCSLKASLNKLISEIDLSFLSTEIPDAVKQSVNGMDKIAKLVMALKNYASNETSETKKLDINKIIRQSAESVSSRFNEILQVKFNAGENLKSFLAEERNLQQIIDNILDNSVYELKKQFSKTQSKGIIEIESKQLENAIEIRISDNGPGISEDVQSHIFDPFYTTRSFDGCLGQGLAIVHRIVHEVLLGTVTVHSKNSEGCTFIVTIPNQQL